MPEDSTELDGGLGEMDMLDEQTGGEQSEIGAEEGQAGEQADDALTGTPFKSAQELARAYKGLQRSYTRASQRLKQLEAMPLSAPVTMRPDQHTAPPQSPQKPEDLDPTEKYVRETAQRIFREERERERQEEAVFTADYNAHYEGAFQEVMDSEDYAPYITKEISEKMDEIAELPTFQRRFNTLNSQNFRGYTPQQKREYIKEIWEDIADKAIARFSRTTRHDAKIEASREANLNAVRKAKLGGGIKPGNKATTVTGGAKPPSDLKSVLRNVKVR